MKNFEARTPFFGVVAEDLMDLVNVAIKKDRCILHFSSGVDDKADSSLVVLRTLSLPVNSVVLIGPVSILDCIRTDTDSVDGSRE